VGDPRWRAAGLAALAAALGIAPCWADASDRPSHTVTIENMQFSPQTLAVKRGDRVVWVNKDLFPHTVTAAKVFDSRSLPPNASWSYVAAKPGRYDYVCTLHPMMKGVLVVE
jgi:plastocyanin